MKTISTYKSEELSINFFQIPIYDSKICFIKYDTSKAYEEAIEFLKKIGVKDESYEADEYMLAYGFTDKQKTDYGIVFFVFINNAEEYKEYYSNTLAHENFHLVNFLCNQHGIIFYEDEDNEPHAYLTGYLFQILSTF